MTTRLRPQFSAFDPDGELKIYMRNMPHWRQPGATYFVTFRQSDSIPAPVLAQWLENRRRWYLASGIDPQWRRSEPDRFDRAYAAVPKDVRRAFERAQSQMLLEELDKCHGSCVLQHEVPRTIVADSLAFFDKQRLWLGDFVLMPNHIHAIIVPFDGWELEELIGSIKHWTSRLIGQWLVDQPKWVGPTGPSHAKPRFWQYETYDRIVRDVAELSRIRSYIANNPILAKLPTNEYTYHSAAWLDQFAEAPRHGSK